ncbi:unnamed protein product [Orchesella dallaii]|uniref:Uncharacterized protein n=1 Tax=Orchesella dallaii TaxID=48710 RepID=A0ABP1RGT1_9HEXA
MPNATATVANEATLQEALLQVLAADAHLLDIMKSMNNEQLQEVDVVMPSGISNLETPSQFNNIMSMLSLG